MNIFFSPTKKAAKFLKAEFAEHDFHIKKSDIIDWVYDAESEVMVVQTGRYANILGVKDKDRLYSLEVDEERTEPEAYDFFLGLQAAVAQAEQFARDHVYQEDADFFLADDAKDEDDEYSEENFPLPAFDIDDFEPENPFTWRDKELLEHALSLGDKLADGEQFLGQGIVHDVSPSGDILLVHSIDGNAAFKEHGISPASYVVYNFTKDEVEIGDYVTIVEGVEGEYLAMFSDVRRIAKKVAKEELAEREAAEQAFIAYHEAEADKAVKAVQIEQAKQAVRDAEHDLARAHEALKMVEYKRSELLFETTVQGDSEVDADCCGGDCCDSYEEAEDGITLTVGLNDGTRILVNSIDALIESVVGHRQEANELLHEIKDLLAEAKLTTIVVNEAVSPKEAAIEAERITRSYEA